MTAVVDDFDALVCDVDGVVVTGTVPVVHAVDTLNSLSLPVVYATNNASRTPAEVVTMLRGHGVEVSEERVLTSSRAAALELAAVLPAGSPVLAVGGPGVALSLEAVGLRACTPQERADVVAVVQGYGTDVSVADLTEVAFAVQSGARWVATNDDPSLPTERGPAPGNGALVGVVRQAVDVDPWVIGKPHPAMYTLAGSIVGTSARRTLAVGDRLGTDIAGARAAGMSAALVLTGVHGPADAAAAVPEARPTHVLGDLRDLLGPYPEAAVADGWFRRGDARARWSNGLVVEGHGMNATRASLDALWSALDAGEITVEHARGAMVTG